MSQGLDEFLRLGGELPLLPTCNHFYFLRHGQTARNLQRIFQAPDEPLNDTGLDQARRAAEVLAGEPIRTIVCSDAHRAMTTALTVAAPHAIEPMPDEALRERNFGVLIGTSSAQIDWACDPAEGESLAIFMGRKHTALTRALALPGPVLVVAHGGSLFALAAMLGVPMDMKLLGNAQPLRFVKSGTIWKIESLVQQQAVDGGAALA